MMKIELLWFDGCPNHEETRRDLLEILTDRNAASEIDDVDVSDPRLAQHLRFPGSPTVRINGLDVEPRYEDSGDYTPRCRVYQTEQGLRGTPDRAWLELAVDAAIESER